MKQVLPLLALGCLLAVAGYLLDAMRVKSAPTISLEERYDRRLVIEQEMVLCPAGEFEMGGQAGGTSRVHSVRLKAFWIDRHEVTNRQFRQFVDATGYKTHAEQVGRGSVLDRRLGNWKVIEGANWRQPRGPGSTTIGRENHPVVQVCWFDAKAYAEWAKKRLPTEAEWEYAARGGSRFDHPWPESAYPAARANFWQGTKDGRDRGDDGFRGTSPHSSFAANRFQLCDMVGNVWEWCQDWYADDYYDTGVTVNPPGPTHGKQRVLRGGSWQSTAKEIAVWRRHAFAPTFCNDQIGFRCARDHVEVASQP